ncbi:tail assembly protein [Enterobacter cloacae]|uniref:tail fiber assembly protein n=1 Tax=Enterobacter cloacae complex TaxID=354276 RepID=UPI001252C8BD|nr:MULTISPECIES: tail fiber assembly protein [Enterobacter cloacae complex]GJK53654.1 tail assembly protein [Enterobacter cloacae]HBI6867875.1 tail fiber assembly protein [Enterobacter cancerogenus]EKS7213394.1 tail fiber assembly protein [Enterobacter ludwigii]MCE2012426.1 tail fiber assembly protein [Enterobacter ludwigii]VAL46352.1 protein YfdK [Enterobacter kobei]
MKDRYFWSEKENGFYPESMKALYENSPDGWPGDAVEISEELYNSLLEGQSRGKVITSGSDGKPLLSDPVIDHIAIAEAEKNLLVSEAEEMILPLQRAVKYDIASDEEKQRLKAWEIYSVKLSRIDTSAAPEIEWPEKPT